jgi:hypothetical protein
MQRARVYLAAINKGSDENDIAKRMGMTPQQIKADLKLLTLPLRLQVVIERHKLPISRIWATIRELGEEAATDAILKSVAEDTQIQVGEIPEEPVLPEDNHPAIAEASKRKHQDRVTRAAKKMGGLGTKPSVKVYKEQIDKIKIAVNTSQINTMEDPSGVKVAFLPIEDLENIFKALGEPMPTLD